MVAYGAAKAGIFGLMNGIKLDAEACGVRVNCISPFTFTRMVVDLFLKELAAELSPDHVWAGVTYLARRECKLNGEVLIAGGGHFGIARTIETLGVDVDDPAAITDTSQVEMFADALAAVHVTFDRLAKRAQAKGE